MWFVWRLKETAKDKKLRIKMKLSKVRFALERIRIETFAMTEANLFLNDS